MKIKELDIIDRPREKLEKYGPSKLSDEELLAIIFRTGNQKFSALEVAGWLLKNYPKEKLVEAKMEDLRGFPGLGRIKVLELLACIELGKRILLNKKSSLILSPEDVWSNLQDIRSSKKEHFVVFYLDSRNQEIERDIISMGTLNTSLVHPREVFEGAVKNLAAQLLVAHNHPSGCPVPSDEDAVLTKRLIESGKLLGIEVVDHVIVCQSEFYSFKQEGLI